MKLKFLILLLIITNCQTHNSGLKSDISSYLKKQGNPTLLTLQFLTVELKTKKEKWPESTNDYVQTFSDSVSTLFSEFKELEFKLQHDTLIILYALKDPQRIKNIEVEFVDPHLYTDSPRVRIKSEVESINKKSIFKVNEGRMNFIEHNDHAFSIVHEYEGGSSKNKITTALQNDE